MKPTPTTRRTVDYVLNRIVANMDAIEGAHETCGIPLEDVLCAVVRRALATRESDAHQMRFWSESKDQP